MPLAFDSVSHGPVAFGFFNIESDMLLLERYFFFATEFCEYMERFAECERFPCAFDWDVWVFADRENIGDLMGAVHGIRYAGFIGETYRRFPFPSNPADFRQKTQGRKNRKIFEAMIEKYAAPSSIRFTVDSKGDEACVGDYRFDRRNFQALIRYVWVGGYPRWEKGERPDYVLKMREKMEKKKPAWVSGLDLFNGS